MHQAPEPAHFTAQPNTRSEMNTTEKRTRSWVASGQSHRCLCGWHTGMLWTWDLTCFILPPSLQTEDTLKGNAPYQTWPSGPPLQHLELRPCPKGCDNQEQRGGPAPHPLQALCTITPVTSNLKGHGQHAEQRCGWHLYPKSPCSRYVGPTHYT